MTGIVIPCWVVTVQCAAPARLFAVHLGSFTWVSLGHCSRASAGRHALTSIVLPVWFGTVQCPALACLREVHLGPFTWGSLNRCSSIGIHRYRCAGSHCVTILVWYGKCAALALDCCCSMGIHRHTCAYWHCATVLVRYGSECSARSPVRSAPRLFYVGVIEPLFQQRHPQVYMHGRAHCHRSGTVRFSVLRLPACAQRTSALCH